jgi:hypothetical protein
MMVPQFWFGHEAEKKTLLYIVGCAAADVPAFPLKLGHAPKQMGIPGRRKDGSRKKGRPEISKADREKTPSEFAAWLVELARRCKQ